MRKQMESTMFKKFVKFKPILITYLLISICSSNLTVNAFFNEKHNKRYNTYPNQFLLKNT